MLLTIITAIIVFSVLIILHELGHFIIAKKSGIRVEEFSLGLGPKIYGIKKGETEYRISAIPFGGYVKLAGAEPRERLGLPYEFYSKPPIIRAGVIATGPIFNFGLAIFVFFIIYSFFGIPKLPVRTIKAAPGLKKFDEIIKINDEPVRYWNDIIKKIEGTDSIKFLIKRDGKEQEITVIKKDTFYIEPLISPIIGKVGKNTPAWKTGIRAGDIIIKINNEKIPDWDSLVSIIKNNPEKELLIGWLHNGKYKEGIIIPEKKQIFEDGKIKSIGMIGIEMKMDRKRINPFYSIKLSILRTFDIMYLTFSIIRKLIIRELEPTVLGGPVSIIKIAGETAAWGVESVLVLIGVLSINLFIFNLIPFPPLDGGQLLLILIEKIKRKPISELTIKIIQNIGMSLLILLALYVTFNDIIRIVK